MAFLESRGLAYCATEHDFHFFEGTCFPAFGYGHSTSHIQFLAGIVVNLLSGDMD